MTVKTAISLQGPLLRRIDAAANELGLSRSAFLANAAEQMVTKLENVKLLSLLNEAYDDSPDDDERQLLDGIEHLIRQQATRDG